MKAWTAIKHGKADGSVVTYEPGDTVKKSDFSDLEWEALKEAGAIAEQEPEGTPPATAGGAAPEEVEASMVAEAKEEASKLTGGKT